MEISKAAELHIKSGQLEITTEDGVALIPIEDLDQIMAHGANIWYEVSHYDKIQRVKVLKSLKILLPE